jgi:signal transduction histidine kinase
LIEERNCVIENDILPEIEAIPIQMSQLFTNLISNSLKFISPDRQPMLIIRCVVMSKRDLRHYANLAADQLYYKFSFTDNGIGFNQDNAVQIFDIFQRLHTRSEFEGTGIGLAMCKKITENHKGLIHAKSEPGIRLSSAFCR